MKKQYSLSLLLPIFCILLSACAVGPLVMHETARTVGQGHDELSGGYGTPGYVFKWSHGFSNNLDFGAQLESLSIGVRAKYAFVNAPHGWSFAGAGGIGESIGGSHYYGDLMASYMNETWEPYGGIRIVHAKTDPSDFKDENTGDVAFTVKSTQYTYGQYIIGARAWFDKKWFLSMEASSLFSMSSDFDIEKGNVLIGLAFGARL
jgi:hypothetical protein